MTAAPTLRPVRAGRSDYAELSSRIRAAGLLERRTGYYVAKYSLTWLVFAAGWLAFAVIGASWWQLVTAAVLGVLSTQIAFLGHDAGHKQVARTRRGSYLLGLLHGNLAVGLSFGWWLDKHNRHHAHPNHAELDPDVAPAGPLIFFPEDGAGRRGLFGWLTRHQAAVFFPLLLLEGLNLHVASLQALRSGTIRARWLETGLLAVHLAAFVAAPLLVLTPWQALAFIAVHQAVFGFYMGCSFAPNHKGMPPLTEAEEKDYLRRQVLTARNVRGGRFVDLLLGGLNYQIEHHLFPSMPRPNLRRARPLVAAFCADHGIRYAETGLLASYGLVLGHLHTVGAEAGP
ncbi:fatty acid desaturase family protein [Geodermatophilus sp. CPCC 205506]|uniref:fatty acid desaturase family protein n=1 Tax=Geodermatophilus sp. CPCC 205506 TaxID=2936596 RepID=UPI003EEA63AA